MAVDDIYGGAKCARTGQASNQRAAASGARKSALNAQVVLTWTCEGLLLPGCFYPEPQSFPGWRLISVSVVSSQEVTATTRHVAWRSSNTSWGIRYSRYAFQLPSKDFLQEVAGLLRDIYAHGKISETTVPQTLYD